MADFTSDFWSWLIAATTVVSIVALIAFVWVYSTRRDRSDAQGPQTMGHVWDENLEEYNNPLPRWWLNLFYITLFWGVVYLVMYPGLGAFSGILDWSQTGQYEQEIETAAAEYEPLFEQYHQIPIPELAANTDAIRMGERLFAAYCTTCHGSDARGARGFPNLRDDEWQYGGEPEQIVASISAGRNGLMPAWQEILDENQIDQVTRYVERLAGRKIDAGIAAQGKQIYDQYCVACHGAEAEGMQLVGAPNLKDDVWLYGGSTRKIVESIAVGRNGIMPPHEEFLGPAKIHLLAAYVYQFRNR